MGLEMAHLEQGVNVVIFINKIVSLYRFHFLTKRLFSVNYVGEPDRLQKGIFAGYDPGTAEIIPLCFSTALRVYCNHTCAPRHWHPAERRPPWGGPCTRAPAAAAGRPAPSAARNHGRGRGAGGGRGVRVALATRAGGGAGAQGRR
ncbi:hypothetical protein ACRRTK_013720 [Alexandromys fortis]